MAEPRSSGYSSVINVDRRMASGTDGNDLINANAQNGTGQIHIWARGGNDWINLDFASAGDSFSHGHHARGDDSAADGFDVINFKNFDNVSSVAVGRLDDFDASRDTIKLNGVTLDLYILPANVRIVDYNGSYNDPDGYPKKWLLIETEAGGHLFYALEGARIDMVNDYSADDVASGVAEAVFYDDDPLNAQERHFLLEHQVPDFSTLRDVSFVDQQNVVPDGYAPETGGNIINDIDHGKADVLEVISASQYGDLIAGGLNNDTVNAGDGNDRVWGGSGYDTLNGDAGNDTLYGGTGNDVLNGGAGHDTLNGGSGDDQINGGSGDDRIRAGTGNTTIHGDDGNDQITGGSGSDQLSGDAGNDMLYGYAGNDQLDGGAGRDLLRGEGGNDEISGGSGDDRLWAHSGDDQLDGGAGRDLLWGEGGNDQISGGSGDDWVWAGVGDDTLSGGIGNDHLNGEAGHDIINGGTGKDFLWGSMGDDQLYGDGGADRLYGGAGSDFFDGGSLDDWLWGGSGDDIFRMSTGNDRIADFGNGGDRIDVSGFASDFSQLTFEKDGRWLTISTADHEDDKLWLLDAKEDDVDEQDFVFV